MLEIKEAGGTLRNSTSSLKSKAQSPLAGYIPDGLSRVIASSSNKFENPHMLEVRIGFNLLTQGNRDGGSNAPPLLVMFLGHRSAKASYPLRFHYIPATPRCDPC